MNFVFYEDDSFYYFWKPYGIPSTFGKEKSFLDFLHDILNKNINVSEKIAETVKKQFEVFGDDGEFGLMNRLDNDTAGFLYFAKTVEVFDEYLLLQAADRVEKIYIADVAGNFKYQQTVIAYPIRHHVEIKEKMVIIKSSDEDNRGRGNYHMQVTFVEKLYYDEVSNMSTLKIVINRGIRHQIRAHLAAIGYPIIGDILYNKKYAYGEKLHLYSLGLKIN